MIDVRTGSPADSSPRLRILLLAEEAAGVQVLRGVAERGHVVVAVMTSGAARPDRPSPVRELAERLRCPCWPAEWVKERGFSERVRAADVDLIVNVHSLYVVPGAVLNASRLGSYNMHPGPLPEYAGRNPVSWALFRGETTHAVTIHRMVPEVDAGPIAYQASFDIEERDSALTVSVKCVQAGVPLMVHLVDTAATNPASIPAIVQDRSRRTYYGRDVPQQGRLIWPRPARDVVNFTRACDYLPFRSPWGHPVGHVGGRQVAVAKTTRTGEPCAARPGTVGDVVGRAVRVACADEWVLVHRAVMEGQLADASCSLRPGQQFERENGGRE